MQVTIFARCATSLISTMRTSKLAEMVFQKSGWRRRFSTAISTDVKTGNLHETSSSSLRVSMDVKFQQLSSERTNASIYRVPAVLRQVEIKAYTPNTVSIGPYHRDAPSLKEMENLKWVYFRRHFVRNQTGVEFDTMVEAMKELEQEARSCYSEDLEMSSDHFVEMMLVDGCFIINLLEEAMQHELSQESVLNKRWMRQILRRDLIMLENQLPFSVISKLFNLTGGNRHCTSSNQLLIELALRFFNPLMFRDSQTLDQIILAAQGQEREAKHLLDLFRSSILPKTESRSQEPHMFHSMTELNEAGVKVRIGKNCGPLDLSFKKGRLTMPQLFIEDRRGTLYRNMVAFEQCHPACKPDITSYLFFLDGLINSAKDIRLLHYAGVIQHSLGSNKQLANLVNKLCKEVAWDGQDSYLHKIVWMINCYCNDSLTMLRARLTHNYFSNSWVTVSTIAAVFLFYLAIIQTCCGYADAQHFLHTEGFWFSLMNSLSQPLSSVLGVPPKVPLEVANFMYHSNCY